MAVWGADSYTSWLKMLQPTPYNDSSESSHQSHLLWHSHKFLVKRN